MRKKNESEKDKRKLKNKRENPLRTAAVQDVI